MPEVQLPRQVLKYVVERVSGAVATSGGNIALQCIHFQISPKSLTVTASDQSNTLMVTEAGDFGVTFDFLVPAAKLKPIVRQAVDGLVQLGVANSTLTVVAGSTSWDIRMPSV